jgi:hypothetical protein
VRTRAWILLTFEHEDLFRYLRIGSREGKEKMSVSQCDLLGNGNNYSKSHCLSFTVANVKKNGR